MNSRKWILTNHTVLLGGKAGLDFVKLIRILYRMHDRRSFFEFQASDFLCRFLSESLRLLLLKHYAKIGKCCFSY